MLEHMRRDRILGALPPGKEGPEGPTPEKNGQPTWSKVAVSFTEEELAQIRRDAIHAVQIEAPDLPSDDIQHYIRWAVLYSAHHGVEEEFTAQKQRHEEAIKAAEQERLEAEKERSELQAHLRRLRGQHPELFSEEASRVVETFTGGPPADRLGRLEHSVELLAEAVARIVPQPDGEVPNDDKRPVQGEGEATPAQTPEPDRGLGPVRRQ